MNEDDDVTALLEVITLDALAATRWAHTTDLPAQTLTNLETRGLVTIKQWAGRVALTQLGRDHHTHMGVGT